MVGLFDFVFEWIGLKVLEMLEDFYWYCIDRIKDSIY